MLDFGSRFLNSSLLLLFGFLSQVLLESLLGFMVCNFSFLKSSSSLLHSSLVMSVGLLGSFTHSSFEDLPSFRYCPSRLPDSLCMLTMRSLLAHSVSHSPLGSLLLSLQGPLGFGDGGWHRLLGLLQLLLDVLGSLLNRGIDLSKSLSKHVVMSAFTLELVLTLSEASLLDNEGFRSLVVELLSSSKLDVDGLEASLVFSDLRR